MGECQAVVAEAVAAFGRIDILLCCTSQSLQTLPNGYLTDTNKGFSSNWNRRRTLCLTTNAQSRPRSIRNKLLRPSKYNQGRPTTYEKRIHRPHNDHFGNQ